MAAGDALRIGTRGSPLARWQADYVAERLRAARVAVETELIATSGDRDQDAPITNLGTVGAFTKEIQRALLDGRIDLAVHSLKDLPTEATAGLILAAVPERGPADDMLVTLDGRPLDDLAEGSRIGTGSLRRRANLWHVRPDLQMEDIRGNVDTRVAKLRASQYDALVLAAAGLSRLGLAAEMTWEIPYDVLLPAVGQGALGIECRADDERVKQVLAALDHPPTHAAVVAERSLLAALTAGCLAPVGARAICYASGRLAIVASVLSPDGRRKLRADADGAAPDSIAIGQSAAQNLLSQGAGELIAAARGGATDRP